MAATAEDKDYVHLVVAALGKSQGETPQFLVKNVVDFERGYGTYDVAKSLKDALEFKADLIVVALGENVPKFPSAADEALFKASLLKLLQTFQANSQPALVVRSCFWPNSAKDRVLKADCEAVAGTWVDIGGLNSDPSNSALSEGHFKDPGVAKHPGDKGMVAIAQAIEQGIECVQTWPAESQPLPRSTPEAEGVSSAGVEDFLKAADSNVRVLHSFMLLRHGKVVAEGWWQPHSAGELHVMHSFSKSVSCTAAGFAIAEGKLKLDDPVVKFFPDYVPADASANLRAMTIRDLMTMTSGHEKEPKFVEGPDWLKTFFNAPVPHAPGTHFLYNSANIYVLSAIVQKVTGQTLLDYLRPRLFEPLGIDHPVWELSPQGFNLGFAGLHLRTEDVAKYGQFYLQKGQWNGQQLLPAAWAEASVSKQVPNDEGTGARHDTDSRQGYGYCFWLARHGAYRASGAYGQFSFVMPEQDAVLAITANASSMEKVPPIILDRLLAAFHAGALPADPSAQASLQRTIEALAIAGRDHPPQT